MSERPLKDKVIVIVGGTGGIGLSGGLACINAGARIVSIGPDDITTDQHEALESLYQDNGLLYYGDARDPQTTGLAISLAIEKFGRFDGLFHVAGGSGRRWGDGPLHEMSDEGLEQTLALNLYSVVFSNRAAVCAFLEQKQAGAIVNIGSALADEPSPRYFETIAYPTAKGAVETFTRHNAAHYAKDNIRFNIIAPGLTETPMAQRAMKNEAIMRFAATKQPLDGGRPGQPKDLDAAVIYFLSDQSRFVTGQVLKIDGGWSVSEGQYDI